MDNRYMKRALCLAKKGLGFVSPNPLVGAVIVKDNEIIGEGYHEKYGEAHAEVQALANAHKDVKGATLYVNLEPCAHYGKTPPCVEAIIQKEIKRVVIAMEDPNPLVKGKGIKILMNHGIDVKVGVMKKEALKLNEVFIKYITKHQPFCTLKTAMSLDGKIATYTGQSKWITNKTSRKVVHQLRHQSTAIMVGVNTVISDNPLLTTRLKGINQNPIRIIVDTKGRIPLYSNVLKCDLQTQTIIATTEYMSKETARALQSKGVDIIWTPIKNGQVDLLYLMKILGDKMIDSILLEGGGQLNFSMLNEGHVDKIIAFIAPKIIGGSQAKTPVEGIGMASLEECITLNYQDVYNLDGDIIVEAYVKKERG